MAETTRLANLALTAVALILGVAVAAMATLASIDAATAVSLLGIGLAALALASVDLHTGST